MKIFRKKIIGIFLCVILSISTFFAPKYLIKINDDSFLTVTIFIFIVNTLVSARILLLYPRKLIFNFLIIMLWIFGQKWIFELLLTYILMAIAAASGRFAP